MLTDEPVQYTVYKFLNSLLKMNLKGKYVLNCPDLGSISLDTDILDIVSVQGSKLCVYNSALEVIDEILQMCLCGNSTILDVVNGRICLKIF